MTRAAQHARALEAASQPFDWGQWLYQYRQAKQFGRSAPDAPPMGAQEARETVHAAFHATWNPCGPTVAEYQALQCAIDAAQRRHGIGKYAQGEDQSNIRAMIRARDGDDCWVCGKPVEGRGTIEHKIAVSRGGSDELDNLALAHERCNKRVGNLPVAEKLRLRAAIQEQQP